MTRNPKWLNPPPKTHCRNCGVPWTKENIYINHYHAPACRNCKKVGRERWENRRKLGLAPTKQERAIAQKIEQAKPAPIDHTNCDPPNLCDECAELYRAARKATA